MRSKIYYYLCSRFGIFIAITLKTFKTFLTIKTYKHDKD